MKTGFASPASDWNPGTSNVRSSCTRHPVAPRPPHPSPLPVGAREPEVFSPRGVIANSTVLVLDHEADASSIAARGDRKGSPDARCGGQRRHAEVSTQFESTFWAGLNSYSGFRLCRVRAQGAAGSLKSSYNILRGRRARAGLGPAIGDPDVSRSLPICCGKGAGSLERELKSRASNVKVKAQFSNLIKSQVPSVKHQAWICEHLFLCPSIRGDAGQPGPGVENRESGDTENR
jgi:hypothetical protein